MRIAVDLDWTLNRMLEIWLQRYNADYADALTVDDITEWDIHHFVKDECGKAIYPYLNDPTLYLESAVQPGAQEAIKQWQAVGHDVIVVSSLVPGAYDAKVAWLKEHFPNIPTANFIACSRKELIKADALVDDGYHNLEHFKGWRILFAAPWNRKYHGTPGLSIADGWGSVSAFVLGYTIGEGL